MSKLSANLLPAKPLLQKRSKAGRPAGTLAPTAKDKMERTMPMIYEAIRRNALAGDAESARLCADIIREPEKFPMSDSRMATHVLDG